MKKMWGIVFSFFIALFCVILDDNRVDASEGDAKVMEVIWNNQTLGSYSTFSDALDAFNSVEGATIKVISDYDFTSDGLLFEFSSSGVLDLNGHILTNNHQNEDLLKLMILENSSLKIIDSADVIRETRYRYNPEALHLLSRDENGDVVVSGGIIDASGAYSVSDVLPVFWVYGSLELVSGNLVGISVTVYDGENYPNIKEGDNGSFVMRGGSILGGGNQYESVAVSMARDSLVSIYGGSIMYHNWKAIGVSGKLNIYGGTFKYNQTIAQTYSYEGDVINIYGGLFENNGICFTFEIGNTWNLYGGTFRNNNIGIVSMMDVFVSGNLIFENNVFEYNGATLYPDIALVQDASVGLNAKIVVDGKLGEDTLIRVGIVTSDMSIVLGEAIVNYNNFNTDNFKDHFASAVSGLDVGSDGASIYMVMANKAINYELNGGEFVQQCLVLHEYPLGYGARLPISSCVVKKGYSFLGWTSTNDAEDVTYISNVPTGATEDVTVYAKWEIRAPSTACGAGA